MSGPKVVRIVTREEVREICLGELARVDEALREWERIGNRNGVIRDGDRARMTAQAQQLRQLLNQDQFVEVQKRAPELVQAIRSDMAERVENLYAEHAAEQRREKSLRLSAKQLYQRLVEAKVDLPPDVQTRLSAAASNPSFPAKELQGVVAEALRRLPDPTSRVPTPQQAELVRQLTGTDKSRGLDDWLASCESVADSPAARTLDRYLGQLAACGESEELKGLAARAEAIYSETSGSHRKMLLDSLCLDAAAAVRRGQAHLRLKQEAADEIAAVAATGGNATCQEAIANLQASLTARDWDNVQKRLGHLKEAHAAAAQSRAAEASRSALLAGLKELGYVVNEGMTTAWTRNKRLVVRNPAISGVALELGGVNASNQFQVRVASVQGERRDGRTDRQVETEWCADLAKMQNRLRELGTEITIERAIPAGAQALKVIAAEDRRDERPVSGLRTHHDRQP